MAKQRSSFKAESQSSDAPQKIVAGQQFPGSIGECSRACLPCPKKLSYRRHRASAGGLEAIESFFKHLPPDSGMAFVIVQHLDPTHQSSMPEIMSRLTKMPVCVASDGLKIAINSVYLIPPDKNIGIKTGTLYLKEAEEPRGLRLPIISLPFSGKRDGSQCHLCYPLRVRQRWHTGLKGNQGGAGDGFCPEPESARYDGMPRSAVNTGLADSYCHLKKCPGR